MTCSPRQERLLLWMQIALPNGIGWAFSFVSRILAEWLIENFDSLFRLHNLSASTWTAIQIVVWLLAGSFAGYTGEVYQTSAVSVRDFRSKLWSMATVLGLGAGFVGYGYSGLSNSMRASVGLFVALGALIGGIVGGLQWLTLRQRYYRAELWIAANTIVWALGFLFVFEVQAGLLRSLAVLMGSLLATFTLLWLLRHPVQQQPAEVSAL